MSELTKSLVLAGAFVAFILAAQEGGSWHGPHSLRKSLHPKGATVGMQEDRYGCDGCLRAYQGIEAIKSKGATRS